MGVQLVHLAFDADAWTKPGVARHLADCAEGLQDAGFEVRLERWDAADGKGIDDLLAAGKQPEVVAGDRLLEVLGELGNVTATLHFDDDEEARWVPAGPGDEVAPFPIDCLPEPLKKFATEAARAVPCPVDFVAVSVLAVAAAAIGNSRRLRIRPRLRGGLPALRGDRGGVRRRQDPGPEHGMRAGVRGAGSAATLYEEQLKQFHIDLEGYEIAKKAASKGKGTHALPLEKPAKPTRGPCLRGEHHGRGAGRRSWLSTPAGPC